MTSAKRALVYLVVFAIVAIGGGIGDRADDAVRDEDAAAELPSRDADHQAYGGANYPTCSEGYEHRAVQ